MPKKNNGRMNKQQNPFKSVNQRTVAKFTNKPAKNDNDNGIAKLDILNRKRLALMVGVTRGKIDNDDDDDDNDHVLQD